MMDVNEFVERVQCMVPEPVRNAKLPWRLIILAIVCFIVIIIWTTTPSGYDMGWWKEAGLLEKRVHPPPFDHELHAKQKLAQPEPAIFSPDHHVAAVDVNFHSNTRLAIPRKKIATAESFGLVNGKHYFADYDISKVVISPDPPIPLGRQPLFRYMDPWTAPHEFIWASNMPRIAVIPNFLSDKECAEIIRAAESKMQRSQVVPFLHSTNKPVDEARTSSGAWLDLNIEPVKTVIQRVYAQTGFPQGSSEQMQILRYQLGQKYDAHQDYFDPRLYGKQVSQRALTAYLYLSDVEEGGETQFPMADGKPQTYDYKSCSKGLRFRPMKRALVIFYDMKPNGETDPWSLHGSCPVKKGVKWGGVFWLRLPLPK